MQFERAGQYLPKILLFYRDTETLHDYVYAGMEMQAGNYNHARELFQGLKPYRAAEGMLRECDYREALSLMNEGQFDAAKKLFLALADYQDAADRVKQCDYNKALALVADGKYKPAIELFSKLGGYRDAKQQIKATYYSQAVSLANGRHYIEAIEAFKNADDYSDAAQQIGVVRELAYNEGLMAFEQAAYGLAREYFRAAGNYSDADMYRTVLDAVLLSSGNYDSDELQEIQCQKLMNLWEKAPARRLIAEKYMKQFLIGNWRNGQNFFELDGKKDGKRSRYSLSIYSGGKYYKIEGNTYYTGDDDSGWQAQMVFSIIDKNQIQVYTYKSGKTYTLYRQ